MHYLRSIYLVLFLWSSALLADVENRELGDPHYTVYRTWALSPPGSENPFKIIAFLPEGYLFHILEEDSESVSNNKYSLVLTQDGVEVLLYSGAISDLTFRQAIGSHELIFNSRYQLCKEPDCRRTEANTWAVARSEAFKIIGKDGLNIKVKATRGWEVLEGYLSMSELTRLVSSGVVTRTDRELPRYRIKKSKSPTLSTVCGEERSANKTVEVAKGDLVSNRLASLMQMGNTKIVTTEEGQEKNLIELTQDYGSSGYLYSFYLYEIEDRSTDKNSEARFFDAAAGFKVSCTLGVASSGSAGSRAAGRPTKDYIDHAIFVNSLNQFNGQPLQVGISSELFNTPRDIRRYTSDAYMISINKPEHFERAIEILSGKIGDRTLAGYMLTELNRSCRSELRVQYSGSVCRIYDY